MSFLKNFMSDVLTGFLDHNANNVTIDLSCGGDSFTLPVLPEKFELSVNNRNGTVNINNDGEYNMIGKTGLKTITLESFFPSQQYDFCVTTPLSPSDYVNKLETWRKGTDSVQITITNTPIDISCLIESFSYGSQDCTQDIYYKLALKEYRSIVGVSNDKMDKTTGLKKRPESFAKQAMKNFRMYPGENPLQAVARACGKTVGAGIDPKYKGYLNIYERVMKGGGINAGDIIQLGQSYGGVLIKHFKREDDDITMDVPHYSANKPIKVPEGN